MTEESCNLIGWFPGGKLYPNQAKIFTSGYKKVTFNYTKQYEIIFHDCKQ